MNGRCSSRCLILHRERVAAMVGKDLAEVTDPGKSENARRSLWRDLWRSVAASLAEQRMGSMRPGPRLRRGQSNGSKRSRACDLGPRNAGGGGHYQLLRKLERCIGKRQGHRAVGMAEKQAHRAACRRAAADDMRCWNCRLKALASTSSMLVVADGRRLGVRCRDRGRTGRAAA